MKTILVSIIVAILSIGGISLSHAAPNHQTRDIPNWVVKPCAKEGDVNCRWDAHKQGNGIGYTYIVRQVPGKAHMVCVFYVEPAYAKTHDYCS